MKKIVTVCGAGVGSSLMLKLYVDQIISTHNWDASVEASDISSVSADSYDIVITTSDFADILRNTSSQVIRIDNLMDKKYLEERLIDTFNKIGEK